MLCINEKDLVEQIGIGLRKNSYDFEETLVHKHYFLDLKTLPDITLEGVLRAFKNFQREEWKYLLAAWLIFPIITAKKANKSKADITDLFSSNLFAASKFDSSKTFFMSCEDVKKTIKPLFLVLSETEDNVVLVLNQPLV